MLVLPRFATGGFDGDGEDDEPPRFCSAALGVVVVVVGVCFAFSVLVGVVVVGVCFALSVLVGDVEVGASFALGLAGDVAPVANPFAWGSEVPPAPGKTFCLGRVDP